MSVDDKVFIAGTMGMLGILGLACWCLIAAYNHYENVEMPASYRSWVKQTGNLKELTYEEWRALIRVATPDVGE